MKLALFLTALIMSASFVQAKDRYLVVFKSKQGHSAMVNYFASEAAKNAGMQKSLKHVNAVVLKTTNKNYINQLKSHPEVASVEAEFFIPTPKPINGFQISKTIVNRVANRLSLVDAATPVLKQGEATPWGILAVHAGEAWGQSAAGANARVLVLDTGIDENHPSIKPNFEQGKNFVEGSNGSVDAADYADKEGHGTHCSGTVLGSYNEATGFTGVAPKAKLLMGKVCGTDGCSNISVVDGINWGIEQKVDVISMSLGGPIGSSSEQSAVIQAESAGVVVVAASGNGANDPNYSPDKDNENCGYFSACGVSFPAAFDTVVAVGALDSALLKTNFSQWGPELDVTAPGAAVISSVPQGTGRDSEVVISLSGIQRKIPSAAFSGTELFLSPITNSLVAVPGVGKAEDFANVNVAGKFALISRGEIRFTEKVQNALNAKAVGVVIYNNVAGLMQGSLSEDGALLNIPVVMIEKTEGLSLVDALTKGGVVSAGIATKPSDYASFDGTSMATPHVAGVVALIKSANKNLTPAQVRTILTSTAKALAPNDTNQYGAGIVQADQAVQAAVNIH